ncbi:sugar phosphate isomerase/epimerase family protein [Paenibacillus cymbidii]|uniref:sugar phosphate isomerase/epimerase family protein n=1 Tax=Paenibacillus cymbidii TaxID=1639034 RepID=UPI0014368D75|nr:sugar phosphate isomerase/epimerase family protein [Paenibacillus cymbidii]
MKIAFSTLGCPAWSWERILDQAASLGYDGIEVRGVNGEMSLAACEPFRPDRITHTLRQLRERELDIVCLGTSCSFHDKSGFVRAVEEGMAAIELAQRLCAPYIRVFGGTVPEFGSKEETVHQVVHGLRTLCGHAAGRDVTVLLETHGDFCLADDVANIVRKVGPGRFGVLWDMGNTAKHHTGGAPSGESPEKTVGKLASSIRHVHFKDTPNKRVIVLPIL